uniref:ZP domain-containing protein n=1 Tax=Ciona savignyi TaxID=51511 RepID=H2Z692_CIOSA
MIRVASRSGDLNLVLRRLTDTWADEPSTNVTVGQRIYFGMDLPVISQRYSLLLQATKCWVTPTETESASTPKYPVITAGVAAPDPTLAGANVVNMNNAERLRASFVSFVWDGQPLSNQLLFLHCRVRVCDNSIANNNCSSPTARRRRSASDIEKKVTLGPFTVENVGSHDVCNKENTMCEHECAVENSGLVVCTCPRGSVLKVDGKGCYKMNPMAETLHVRMIDADRRLDNSVHSISCILGVVTILVTMWVVITHLE